MYVKGSKYFVGLEYVNSIVLYEKEYMWMGVLLRRIGLFDFVSIFLNISKVKYHCRICHMITPKCVPRWNQGTCE